MKKILFVLCISLLLLGCGSSYKPAEGDVISYVVSSNYGTIEDINNYSFIYVNSDKTIKSGRVMEKDVKTKKLSDKEYNEIISVAFSKDFKKLDKDLSTDVMDGYNSYITVYYKDGTSFKTGGLVPDNKTYEKLVNLLEKYK